MIGDKLRQLREDKGLTAKQVGEQIDVSEASALAWENGRCEPQRRLRERLCELYGISAGELYGAEPDTGKIDARRLLRRGSLLRGRVEKGFLTAEEALDTILEEIRATVKVLGK